MNNHEQFTAHAPRSGPSRTPTLDQMGIDLTAQARRGKMATAIGYDKDLVRLIQVLSRRVNARTGFRKYNVVLISEPKLRMRKLAILEGLAQLMSAPRIAEVASGAERIEPSWLSLCQEQLQGKRLVTLEVGLLVAGTTSPSEVEERFKKILEEIRSSQDCIIFIDELHALVGAEAAWGRVDLAPLLVPALVREELQCMGATTLAEYRQYIEKDLALQRRFQEVIVHGSGSRA